MDFPYKLAIFSRVEYSLIVMENSSSFHQLLIAMWKPFQAVLVQKFQGIFELQALKVKSMKKAHFSI